MLMHPPPRFGDRLDPHPEWGFSVREQEFLELVHRHRVTLVCSAHALLFDQHLHRGTRFLVSGGGGTALCSHLRGGMCASDDGLPADRGSLFHAVRIVVGEAGEVSGRVLQAFDPVAGRARLTFGDRIRPAAGAPSAAAAAAPTPPAAPRRPPAGTHR